MKSRSSDQPNRLATVLQPFVDSHSLAGAVTLVATRNKILDVTTVGFADVAARKPLRPDGVFWIASTTKPLTGAALMMLVEEGRVSLNDPVTKYLPAFAHPLVIARQSKRQLLLRPAPEPIRLRHLLTHTSGLPFSSALETPTMDGHPLRTTVQSYAMLPLQSKPGTQYLYSNAGINSAARILEIVSGQSYEAFMAARLFEPLGMTETTFWPSAAQIRRLANAYRPDAAKTGLEKTTISQLRYPLNDRSRYPMPAGGLFSTARDLARFGQMILNHGTFAGRRYLSKAAIAQMTRKQTGPKVSNAYGFGWGTGKGWCGHGGALSNNFVVDWRHGLVLVFMVQHAGFPGNGGQSYEAFKQAALQLH